MLTKSILKKIFLSLSCLVIVFIIYLFPTKKNTIKTIETHSNKEESIIYLKDNNTNYLARVSLYFNSTTLESKIKEILKYLTINSKNANYIKNGFSPIIPENTKVLSISIDKTLAKINFSKELLNINKEDEEKMISAIIYSLTSLDKIDSVSIYIEGNLLTNLPNSKEKIDTILNRSFGINKTYNITNYNNTVSTTIYFLSKKDDYYYYVPVTMISNNKQDKMEIIIKELASKASYQTGLISFLNDAKQMSFEINDNLIQLNLEKNLFYNLNASNLLETVIYSMNLAIKDNYNITKVIYLVDNNVYKTCYI